MTGLFKRGILRALLGYFRRDVAPRATDILWTQHTLIAGISGLAIAFGARWITGAPRTTDIALGFLAYAALALGFCVAGITIALTLPDRDFLHRLAKHEVDGKAGNALSGLLFVFTWAGFVHWLCIVNLVCVLLLDGGNPNPFTKNASAWRLAWIGITTALCTYALETFLITVLTLGHVGRKFIDELRKDPGTPGS